ncbi:Mur ligase domain-containing protein, partial [Immundisolibacter sp.]|uniref:Mur ligase domain-containing protein n=1 Tax=Immundisolibacter sp. TaxID=1934948 RepID=UPI0035685E87
MTVGGLCNDSRRVRPGDLFLAVPGQRTSGTRHLDQAIAAGAVAALVDASLPPPAAASVP